MRNNEKTLEDYPLATIFLLGMAVVIAFFAAIFIGWVSAHNIVAHECNKLGSFYVGNVVYECRPKQIDK